MVIICPKCGFKGNSSLRISRIKKLKCRKCGHIFSVRPSDTGSAPLENIYTSDSPTLIKTQDADSNIPLSMGTHLLKVLSGVQLGKQFRLTKFQNIIGRRNADITLNDPMISRQHAIIEIFDTKALLKDLGSSNGIYYNGKRIKIVILNQGDKIQLGETILEYTSGK